MYAQLRVHTGLPYNLWFHTASFVGRHNPPGRTPVPEVANRAWSQALKIPKTVYIAQVRHIFKMSFFYIL